MVSLVQAREKRNEARAILDEGKDPAIVKKLTIEANRKAAECTIKKLAKEWHEMSKSQWASVHADDVIRSLERDVFPAIGNFPIADLNQQMTLKALQDIAAPGYDQTAKRGRPRSSAVWVYDR